jgi:predicted metal-dependent phosphoesterase TrpH
MRTPKEYDVLVLKGSELDTRYGHFLVYGIDEEFAKVINFKDVTMNSFTLMTEARQHGAIAIPAHPGRIGIGLVEWMAKEIRFPDVRIVERLNAGNRPEEQYRADHCPTR